MTKGFKKFNREIAMLRALSESEKSQLLPMAKEAVKQRVLLAATPAAQELAEKMSWKEKTGHYLKYFVSTLLGLSLLGGTAFAANSARPGDILFPIKKTEETIAVSLAVTEQSKAVLQTKFAERRIKELDEINAQAQSQVQENNKVDDNLTHAEDTAQTEISQAIEDLTQRQVSLEAKGNLQTASSVAETIVKLKDRENKGRGKNRNGGHGRGNGDSEDNINLPTSTIIQLPRDRRGQDRQGTVNGTSTQFRINTSGGSDDSGQENENKGRGDKFRINIDD